MGISKRSGSPPQVAVEGWDHFADAELASSSDEESDLASSTLVEGQVDIRSYLVKQGRLALDGKAPDEASMSTIRTFDLDTHVESSHVKSETQIDSLIADEEAARAMGLRLDLQSDEEEGYGDVGFEMPEVTLVCNAAALRADEEAALYMGLRLDLESDDEDEEAALAMDRSSAMNETIEGMELCSNEFVDNFLADEEAASTMGLRFDLDNKIEDCRDGEGRCVRAAAHDHDSVSLAKYNTALAACLRSDLLTDTAVDSPGAVCPTTPKKGGSLSLTTKGLDSSSPPTLKRNWMAAQSFDVVNADKLDPPSKVPRLGAILADVTEAPMAVA